MATSCVEYQVGESIKVPIWYNYSTKEECRSAYSQFHFCNVDCTNGNPGNDITISKYNGSSLVVYSQTYRNVNMLTGCCCSGSGSPYDGLRICNDTDLVQIVDYCGYWVSSDPVIDDGCYVTQASIMPIKFLVNPHTSARIPRIYPACVYCCGLWYTFAEGCWTAWNMAASLMLTRTIRTYPLPSPTNGNTWSICNCYYYDGGAKQPKWFSVNCIDIPIAKDDEYVCMSCAYRCTDTLCACTGYSIPSQVKPVIGTDENNNPFTLARYSPCLYMVDVNGYYYTCCNGYNNAGLNRDALVGILAPEMHCENAWAGSGSCTRTNNWCCQSNWCCVKSYVSGRTDWYSLRAYSPCLALGSTSNAVTLNDELVEPKGPYYCEECGEWIYYKDAFSVRCNCHLTPWGCANCCWALDPILIYKGIDFNPTCADGFTCVAFVSCIKYKE